MHDIVWRLKIFREEFKEFAKDAGSYSKIRIFQLIQKLESLKDVLVDILMARRGVHQRSFLHVGMMILISSGIMFGPIIANDYPILGGSSQIQALETPSSTLNLITSVSELDTSTIRSEKPRDSVIAYTVESGDTLSSIATKFGISVDTIKWANSEKIKSDNTLLHPGDELKVPPVTGIVHKVKSGDTIYTIAKKYGVASQNIINYPFNTFVNDETFALAINTELVVPDGEMPVEQPVYRATPQAVTLVAGGTGQYIWPASGSITQYPVWYHLAVDIANPSSPAVVAADTGTVVVRQCLTWGYGCHIIIDHGNGFQTLYAHMQAFYVNLGDRVNRGQSIGQMGSTGRSTGTHLHFEVRRGGVLQNPLSYLR